MCKGVRHNEEELVLVYEEVNYGGGEFSHLFPTYKRIDKCIAPLVQALNHMGIRTKLSCCGHGERQGYIWLDDGRIVLILDREHSEKIADAVINKHDSFNLYRDIDKVKPPTSFK